MELIERCCFRPSSAVNATDDRPARISIDLSNPAQRWLLFHATWIGLFTFVVGYTFYLSLPLISVAANVAIYNAAGAFVYIFCLLFGMEKLNPLKILSLLFSIGEFYLFFCIAIFDQNFFVWFVRSFKVVFVWFNFWLRLIKRHLVIQIQQRQVHRCFLQTFQQLQPLRLRRLLRWQQQQRIQWDQI